MVRPELCHSLTHLIEEQHTICADVMSYSLVVHGCLIYLMDIHRHKNLTSNVHKTLLAA
jgi:hypothetical protein